MDFNQPASLVFQAMTVGYLKLSNCFSDVPIMLACGLGSCASFALLGLSTKIWHVSALYGIGGIVFGIGYGGMFSSTMLLLYTDSLHIFLLWQCIKLHKIPSTPTL